MPTATPAAPSPASAAASLLDLLHDRLGRSAAMAELEKQLEGGKRGARSRVLLAGPREADLSFVAGALHRRRQAPTLLVAPRLEPTERHYDDLFFFGLPAVHHYPAWETLPFENEPLNIEVMAKRLDTLAHLAGISLSEEGAALPPPIVCAPIDALLQLTVPPDWLRREAVVLQWGESVDPVDLGERLARLGYTEAQMVEGRGEYSIRGGIIDIFSLHADYPVRLDLFGREIESMRRFDLGTQRSIDKEASVERVVLLPADERRMLATALADGVALVPVFDYFAPGTLVVQDAPELFAESLQKFEELVAHELKAVADGKLAWSDPVTGQPATPDPTRYFMTNDGLWQRLHAFTTAASTRMGIDNDTLLAHAEKAGLLARACDMKSSSFHDLKPELETWLGVIRARQHEDFLVIIVCDNEGQAMRFTAILREHEIGSIRSDNPAAPNASLKPKGALEGYPDVVLTIGTLSEGFVMPDARVLLVTDREVFGRYKRRHVYRKIYKGTAMRAIDEIERDDYVVHVEHGIGQYLGMRRQLIDGEPRDLIEIMYKDDDRLLVPVDKIQYVQKYTAHESAAPQLDKLGGNRWKARKAKSKEQIEKLAGELLELYAERATAQGWKCPADNRTQLEFEAGFLYRETPDQLAAIAAAKKDMEGDRPMDRLVCGDVGYGKTEVAIRTAFKCVQGGRQVALLCPTTILAQQHYMNFKERFADYPVRVELLSRFRSQKEITETLKRVATGECQMVIGTHRLLGKDVTFKDLGLLCVDEEQRFGVAHKEKLKQLKSEIDVLTLTATPIPRTLYMALSGLRDMSLIVTPPADRYPVKTRVISFDKERIEEAILREMNRGGQVYFVHNRVHNIEDIKQRLQEIVPKARIVIGHGQMDEDTLERVMVEFIEGKHDILLATTIIENGLDIPNCNTIIVNRADAFGLAQLYQLRGRVGRSNRRSYAYLIVPEGQPITEAAVRRLESIQEFTELGVGFQIAMRDMEIRGTGNILGAEQHGTMEAIGFDLYCELLEESVRRTKGQELAEKPADIEITWRLPAFIPGEYIPVESQRLSFYKKVAATRSEDDVKSLEEEIRDRYGKLPEPMSNILGLANLRVLCVQAGARRVAQAVDGIKVYPKDKVLPSLAIWNDLLKDHPGVEQVMVASDHGIQVRIKAWGKGRQLEKAIKLMRAFVARDKGGR